MGMAFLVFVYLSVCAVFGFFAASFLHKIFRSGLRFHADWTKTFIASMLTCLVTGIAFCCSGASFDDTDGFKTAKMFGTTFFVAFVTGVFAFRFIIKSESGRSLSLPMSAFVAFALTAPPLVLVSVVSMMVADY
jgi:hypothetical protein